MSSEGARLVPGDHPDRVRWNARDVAGFVPSFTLIDQSDLPDRERRQILARRRGPEIACLFWEATQGDGI